MSLKWTQTTPDDLARLIDEARGGLSRSEYMNLLARDALMPDGKLARLRDENTWLRSLVEQSAAGTPRREPAPALVQTSRIHEPPPGDTRMDW